MSGILAGIGGLASGIGAIGNVFSAFGAQSQNAKMLGQEEAFSAQQAAIERNWETQMSDTAYQRSVKDMKAAGLNPVLGVSSGGASTPTMGLPSPGSPSGGVDSHVGSSLGEVVSNAVSVYKTLKEAEKVDADINNTNQQAKTGAAQASNLAADTANKAAGLPGINQDVINKSIQAGLLQSQTDAASSAAAASRASAGASSASAGLSNAQAAQVGADTAFRAGHFGATPPVAGAPVGLALGLGGEVKQATQGLAPALSSAASGVSSAVGGFYDQVKSAIRGFLSPPSSAKAVPPRVPPQQGGPSVGELIEGLQ